MNLPKILTLPQISAAKAGLVILGVVVFAGLVYAYGEARYHQGRSEIAVSTLKATADSLKQLQTKADDLTRLSNDLAIMMDDRTKYIGLRTDSILAASHNKPLAQVNSSTGKCAPTDEFKKSWNDLSNSVLP